MLGTLIDGRYELLDKLGQGGMAQVFRARDHRLKREVAIKFLAPQHHRSSKLLERFQQETETLARLNHEHIVILFDVGVTADHRQYLVMERLRGETLAQTLRGLKARSEDLSFPRLVSITRQICEGLAAAHSAGIIHRDIKPSNIFLTTDERTGRRDRVKLLDFGIAKAAAEGGARITEVGTFLGTPHYAAPEMINPVRFGEPDARADIFSLGVVLFECATGSLPFAGLPRDQVIRNTVLGELPSPCERRSLPTALETIIRTATAREPAARYASVRDLSRALAIFEASLCRQPGVHVASSPIRVEPGVALPPRPPRRRKAQPPPPPARKGPPSSIAGELTGGLRPGDIPPPAHSVEQTTSAHRGTPDDDENPSTVEPSGPPGAAAGEHMPPPQTHTERATTVESEASPQSGDPPSTRHDPEDVDDAPRRSSIILTFALGLTAAVALFFTGPDEPPASIPTEIDEISGGSPPPSATTGPDSGIATTGAADTGTDATSSTPSTGEAGGSESTGTTTGDTETEEEEARCRRELDKILKSQDFADMRACMWEFRVYPGGPVDVTLTTNAPGKRPSVSISLNRYDRHPNSKKAKKCIKKLYSRTRTECIRLGVTESTTYYAKPSGS